MIWSEVDQRQSIIDIAEDRELKRFGRVGLQLKMSQHRKRTKSSERRDRKYEIEGSNPNCTKRSIYPAMVPQDCHARAHCREICRRVQNRSFQNVVHVRVKKYLQKMLIEIYK